MNITLQEAFGKRNDIKREIEELKQFTVQRLWDEKTNPTNFENGTVIHPKTALSKVIELMDTLSKLNKVIYEANVVNNELLRDLETVGAKISLYESIVSGLRRYPGDKERNRYYDREVDGSKEFLENTFNVDPKEINEKLAFFKKEKRRIEDALRHNNYTLKIEF